MEGIDTVKSLKQEANLQINLKKKNQLQYQKMVNEK